MDVKKKKLETKRKEARGLPEKSFRLGNTLRNKIPYGESKVDSMMPIAEDEKKANGGGKKKKPHEVEEGEFNIK